LEAKPESDDQHGALLFDKVINYRNPGFSLATPKARINANHHPSEMPKGSGNEQICFAAVDPASSAITVSTNGTFIKYLHAFSQQLVPVTR